MTKKTLKDLEADIIELQSQVDQLFKKEPEKPWYMSFGVWLAIILTIIAIYLAYVFYMSETGHTVIIPAILK